MRYFYCFFILYTVVISQTLDEHLTKELSNFTNWGSNNSAYRVSILGPRAISGTAKILEERLRFINFDKRQRLRTHEKITFSEAIAALTTLNVSPVKNDDIVPVLIKALKNNALWDRAVQVVARYGEASLPHLRDMLHKDSYHIRVLRTLQVMRRNAAPIIPEVENLLGKNKELDVEIVKTLLCIGSKKYPVVDSLCDSSSIDDNFLQKYSKLILQHNFVEQDILNVLFDNAAQFDATSAQALAAMWPKTKSRVMSLLHSSDNAQYKTALYILRFAKDSQFIDTFCKGLDSSDYRIRNTCTQALIALGEKTIDFAQNYPQEKLIDIIVEMAIYGEGTVVKKAILFLITALDTDSESLQLDIIKQLGHLHNEQLFTDVAIEKMRFLAKKSSSPKVRMKAIMFLRNENQLDVSVLRPLLAQDEHAFTALSMLVEMQDASAAIPDVLQYKTNAIADFHLPKILQFLQKHAPQEHFEAFCMENIGKKKIIFDCVEALHSVNKQQLVAKQIMQYAQEGECDAITALVFIAPEAKITRELLTRVVEKKAQCENNIIKALGYVHGEWVKKLLVTLLQKNTYFDPGIDIVIQLSKYGMHPLINSFFQRYSLRYYDVSGLLEMDHRVLEKLLNDRVIQFPASLKVEELFNANTQLGRRNLIKQLYNDISYQYILPTLAELGVRILPFLLQELEGKNWSYKNAEIAVRILSVVEDIGFAAIPVLLDTLQKGNSLQKLVSLNALTIFRQKISDNGLIARLLTDDDPLICDFAAYTWSQIADNSYNKTLSTLLECGDENVEKNAAQIFVACEQNFAKITSLLQHQNTKVQEQVMIGLGNMGKKTIDYIMALPEKSPQHLIILFETCRKFPQKSLVAIALDSLKHQSFAVQYRAMKSLAQIAAEEDVLRNFSQKNPVEKMQIVHILREKKFLSSTSLQLLGETLSQVANNEVHTAIVEILAEAKQHVVLPILNEKCLSHDPQQRLWAIKQLSFIPEKSRDNMLKALQDVDADIRLVAAKALSEVKSDPSMLEPLMQAIYDTNYKVRRAAVVALGNLGELARDKCLDSLDIILHDEDDSLHDRQELKTAFQKILNGKTIHKKEVPKSEMDYLKKVSGKEAVSWCLKTLPRSSTKMSFLLADKLKEYLKQDAQSVIDVLNSDVDWKVKAFIAIAISKISGSHGFDFSQYNYQPLIRALIPRLQEKNVQFYARRALAWVHHTSVDFLVEALNSNDPTLSRRAGDTLVYHQNSGSLSIVQDLLRSPKGVLYAVRMIYSSPSAKFFALTKSSDAQLRWESMKLFAEEDSLPFLKKQLQQNSQVAPTVLQILGLMNNSVQATKVLQQYCQDKNIHVSTLAVKMLANTTKEIPTTIAILEKIDTNNNVELQLAVTNTIYHLLSRSR